MPRNLLAKTTKTRLSLLVLGSLSFTTFAWPVLAQDESAAAPIVTVAEPTPFVDTPAVITTQEASPPISAGTPPPTPVVETPPTPTITVLPPPPDVIFTEAGLNDLSGDTITIPPTPPRPDSGIVSEPQVDASAQEQELELLDITFTEAIIPSAPNGQSTSDVPVTEEIVENTVLEQEPPSSDTTLPSSNEVLPEVKLLPEAAKMDDALEQVSLPEPIINTTTPENLAIDPWIVSKDDASEITRTIKNVDSQEVKWFMSGDVPVTVDESVKNERLPISDIYNLSLNLLNSHLDKIGLKRAVSLSDLQQSKTLFNNHKWYVDFTQSYQGIPVHDSKVSLVISDTGKLLAIHSSLKKISSIGRPQVDMTTDQVWTALYKIPDLVAKNPDLISVDPVIFPVIKTGKKNPFDFYDFPLVYKVKVKITAPQSVWTILMDANSGEILLIYNELFFQDTPPQDAPVEPVVEDTIIHVTGKVFNITAGILETVDFPYLNAIYQNIDYFTDVAGITVLPPAAAVNMQDLRLNMDNIYFRILDDDVAAAPPQTQKWEVVKTVDNPITLDVGSEIGQSARTVYYLLAVISSYFRTNMDFDGPKLTAHVNSRDVDNILAGCTSYYNPTEQALKLGRGEGCGMPNHAFSKDIVFHEYVHYLISQLHPLPNIENSQSAAMSEGLADYFAASLSDDPIFGENFLPNPRELRNNLLITDWQNKTHEDSQIFSGSLWDLRKKIGQQAADKLVYNALYAGRTTFENFMYQLIIEDDDDENLLNGTPHLKNILAAFEQHGVGPGVAGFTIIPIMNPEEIPIELDPLFVTENPTITFSVANGTINFGTLSTTAVTSPTITTITIDTNAAEGFEGYIKSTGDGNNPGLYNVASSGLIPTAASSAVVDASNASYGVYVENPSAGITITDAFNNDSANDLAISSDYQKAFSMTTTPAAPETVDLRYKAVIDATTLPGSYVDTVEVIVFGVF